VAVIPCDRREGGQRWTDGIIHYFDDGTVTFAEGGSVVDLVEYIGPFPYSSQRAPVSRPAETESTTAVAGGVSDDPGRMIYELDEKLKTANATIISQTAEIERLQTELRGYAAESHRQLRARQAEHDKATATLRAEQRGAQQAYLAAIKTFLEASR